MPLVFAATPDNDTTLGRHTVCIRRTENDPWLNMPIEIVREATYAEYVAYHVEERLPYDADSPTVRYFAIHMD